MRTGPAWRFETPGALKKVVDKYFNNTPINEITQSGLLLCIGLGKTAFNIYRDREGYEEIVEMAKLRVENAYEVRLCEKGGSGPIFALKQFGWIDRQEHEHSGNANNPLITKIVREVVNVKQIEYTPPVNATDITDDPNDDFSADSGFDDEFDDFLQ